MLLCEGDRERRSTSGKLPRSSKSEADKAWATRDRMRALPFKTRQQLSIHTNCLRKQ